MEIGGAVRASFSVLTNQRLHGRDAGVDDFLLANPKVEAERKKLDDVISELDVKLDRQLKKQEHDYLKGYSIYVKTKEKELKTLI